MRVQVVVFTALKQILDAFFVNSFSYCLGKYEPGRLSIYYFDEKWHVAYGDRLIVSSLYLTGCPK